MPFLTLEDPRARIKGSRDPLGTVPIWSHFGRKLVTNLTIAANSVRGFSIALLGRYFAERLIDDNLLHESEALPLFLRMEQIGAFVRHVGSGIDDDIRGIERVRASLREDSKKAVIADDPRGWILSNQKVYGLWGLFTVSARVSGLFREGPVGLTDEARHFVEATYLPSLEPQLPRLRSLLVKGGTLPLRRNHPLFTALHQTLPDPISTREAEFYGRTIRDALPTPHILTSAIPGRQQHLRELLEHHTDLSAPVSREELARLERTTSDDGLAIGLRQAQVLESLLVLVGPLFDHLQICQGQNVRDIGRDIEGHWGRHLPFLDPAALRELRPEIEDLAGRDLVAVILRAADALAAPDYAEAIRQLIAWNALVMRARGSDAWIRLDHDRIAVRYRAAESRLPNGDALADLWSNSYFLSSLKRITRQIAEAR